MTLREKIDWLIEHSNGQVDIMINEHKACFMSLEQYIRLQIEMDTSNDYITREMKQMMIEKDCLVIIHCYVTETGLFQIYHWDLEMSLDEAIKELKSRIEERPEISKHPDK